YGRKLSLISMLITLPVRLPEQALQLDLDLLLRGRVEGLVEELRERCTPSWWTLPRRPRLTPMNQQTLPDKVIHLPHALEVPSYLNHNRGSDQAIDGDLALACLGPLFRRTFLPKDSGPIHDLIALPLIGDSDHTSALALTYNPTATLEKFLGIHLILLRCGFMFAKANMLLKVEAGWFIKPIGAGTNYFRFKEHRYAVNSA